MPDNQKNWWAPVWRGLVADQEGKHCRRMKNSLWLFLYFVIHADRRTGWLKRKCQTICEQMGMSPKTVRKWLSVLRSNGYVKAKSNGRCLEIQIHRWKSIGESSRCGTLSALTGVLRVPQLGESGEAIQRRNSFDLSQKPAVGPKCNEIIIKRERINDNTGGTESSDSNPDTFNRMDQITKKYLLAFYLAKALNDEGNLLLYLSYSKKYPEFFLMKILEQVKQIPDSKIKKGRGALFNYFIQKHAQTINDSGN